jgi:hypothetical protein
MRQFKKLLVIALAITVFATSSIMVSAQTPDNEDPADSAVTAEEQAENADAVAEPAEDADVAEEEPVVVSVDESEVIEVTAVPDEENVITPLADDSNNNIDTATAYTLGTQVQNSISTTDTDDYYKLVLPTSGKLNIDADFNFKSVDLYLYNSVGAGFAASGSNKEYIWHEWESGSADTVSENSNIYLNSGTYYFRVKKSSSYIGNYSFTITFTSTGETTNETSGGSNNTLGTASPAALNTIVKGQISADDTLDYYKFTLATSGKVSLSAALDMRTYINNIYVYDANGNQIWRKSGSYSDATEKTTLNFVTYLNSGTYYLAIENGPSDYYYYSDYSKYNGPYTFKLAFTTAGETTKEPNKGNNNTLAKATKITAGTSSKTFKGQIAANDTKDYFKFTIAKSGKVNLIFTLKMKYAYIRLYDSAKKEIWSEYGGYNKATEQISHNINTYLNSGTYYVGVESGSSSGSTDPDYSGFYSVKTKFTSAGESFKETKSGSNNTIKKANKISLKKTYKGQISANDLKDYYKVSIPKAGVIKLTGTFKMKYADIVIYDSKGNKVATKWGYASGSGSSFKLNYSTPSYSKLKKGTYYIGVERDTTSYYSDYASKYTGFYTLKVTQ